MRKKIRLFFTNPSEKDKRVILYYFLLFFAITVGPLLIFHDLMKKILDGYFGDGFYIGILPALIENFIFFGTIGLIAQFVSMKSPEDQNFERRVEAVANAAFINPRAKEYLITENRKLLAFNQTADIRLVIKEIDEAHRAFKIYTEFNNTIVNMCKDIDYSLHDTPAKAEAGLFVNDIGGEITHLSLSDENTRYRKTIIEGEIRTLRKDDLTFDFVMPDFTVTANSRAIWKFAFWLWGSMDEVRATSDNWYFLGVLRFTSDFRIRIKNETKYEIFFDYRYPEHAEDGTIKIEEVNENKLAAGADLQIKSGLIFYPKDRFEIFFSKFKP
jgi:hypothetical protein